MWFHGDTKTAVYTDGCAGLILACNDDACGLVSEVRFPAVAGQTYDIRIGNFAVGGGSNGSFTVVPDLPTQNPSNGHFYRVVSTSLSWIDARAAAETTLFQGMPGHLVTISDQAELDWILNNLSPQRPWIGLFHNTNSPNYSEPGGGWEWVTGEPATFLNWFPGEPNNNSASGGPENYAEMFGNGQWNDAELNHTFTTVHHRVGERHIGTTYCTSNPNSTGVTSSLSAAGSLAVSNNDLTLTAADLPPSSFGFFLASQTQGSVANPGGSEGILCLGGAIGRFVGPGEIKNSGANGDFSLALDLTALPSPTGFVVAFPGETWNFQAWHRDSVGGNAVPTSRTASRRPCSEPKGTRRLTSEAPGGGGVARAAPPVPRAWVSGPQQPLDRAHVARRAPVDLARLDPLVHGVSEVDGAGPHEQGGPPAAQVRGVGAEADGLRGLALGDEEAHGTVLLSFLHQLHVRSEGRLDARAHHVRLLHGAHEDARAGVRRHDVGREAALDRPHVDRTLPQIRVGPPATAREPRAAPHELMDGGRPEGIRAVARDAARHEVCQEDPLWPPMKRLSVGSPTMV